MVVGQNIEAFCHRDESFLRVQREINDMAISTEELAGGVTRVILDGKLDIEGAAAIDLKMNIIAGSRKAVLVDLQQV